MKPKILVPIDFSDCTDQVVRKAIEVARELSADVVLMHSLVLPSGLGAEVGVNPGEQGERRPAISYLADEALEQLAGHAEELLAQGVEVKQVVTVGPPAEQILRLADEERVSRIVMGTRGRRGLSRLMLGSVAENVSRSASCPLVIVESEWSPRCSAGSCSWCSSGRSAAQRQLDAELDG
jgi:nucleotide-binding universal stress UspA family protein